MSFMYTCQGKIKNMKWKRKKKEREIKKSVCLLHFKIVTAKSESSCSGQQCWDSGVIFFVPGNRALCLTASHGMVEAKQETCGQRFIAIRASLIGFCVCWHLLIWEDVTLFEPLLSNAVSSCQVTWVCGWTVTWVWLHFQSFPDEKIKARPPRFPVTLQLIHTAATSAKKIKTIGRVTRGEGADGSFWYHEKKTGLC